MGSNAGAPSGITIDITKDLTSASALQSMLKSQGGAIFQLLGVLNNYQGQPIKAAAAAKASAGVTLNGTASWKTSNGIGFSLTPQATCSIGIDTVSEKFAVAMNVESTDPKNTQNVTAGPTNGIVYVNIDLDFSIQGSVSGSGTVSGVGIAGKASGSASATMSFCQPVADSLDTLDAIKQAFEFLVFPLDPTSTDRMQTGALTKVAFDGSFNCELDVTYGLGDYKVSAPDLTSVQQSITKVVQIKSPSLEVNTGVKGSITYTHTDHFALIVNKTSATAAMLYLVRSAENDWGGSLGINVGVTVTAPSVTIDTSQLQSVAQEITGNSTIAGQVASAASQPVNSLTTSLNGKLKSWASDVSGNIGLSLGLSRQSGNTALFVFEMDLTKADLTHQSWQALVGGSVAQALSIGGFTLQPGSGVADSLKRASTIQFQFFNLFSFAQVSDYFSQGYTELGKDGTILIFRDIGDEQSTTTKTALQSFRIYFEATATESQSGGLSNSQVNLCIELSEKGRSKLAAKLANVVGLLPASQAVNSAQEGMVQFVAGNPSGTLDLKVTLKSSAYQQLSSSPFNSKTPPPLPQQQDKDNWLAFQTATESLDSDLEGLVGGLSYRAWAVFNVASNFPPGMSGVPNRKSLGNPQAVPQSFFDTYGPEAAVVEFLTASQGFMNLCDNLQILAKGINNVENSDQWKTLLAFLTQMITKDVYIEFAMPTAGALFELMTEGGAQVTSALAPATDGSSLTCTLTVS